MQVSLMSYVEAAVLASPDLDPAETRRYHQQWMHIAFSTMCPRRVQFNKPVKRRDDEHWKATLRLIKNETGQHGTFLDYLFQEVVATSILTDSYMLECNPGWTDWMLYIMERIVSCYYNEAPKYGFARNDVRLLADRLTRDTGSLMKQHVYQLHFCDLQIRTHQQPDTEFKLLAKFKLHEF